MILALALSSCLSAVPHSWILEAPRSARLAVKPDDVAEAAVDRLTLPQLLGEQHRLIDDLPGLAGPITLLSVGGAGIFAFGGLTYYLVDLTVRPGAGIGALFTGFLAFLTGALTIVAIVGAIIGTVLLIRANNRRDEYALRGGEVAARIAAIDSGQALEPPGETGLPSTPQELATDRNIRLLEDSRPGLGLPLGLMGGGLGAAIYAIGPFLSGTTKLTGPLSTYTLNIAAGIIAAGLSVTGAILLVLRIQDRIRIGADIEDARRGIFAPPGPTDEVGPPPLPPLPAPEPIPGGQPSPPPPPPQAWAPPGAPLLFSWATTF